MMSRLARALAVARADVDRVQVEQCGLVRLELWGRPRVRDIE